MKTLISNISAGLAVMILLSPISNFFITKLNDLESRQRKNKDQRVKLMNEILGGIKVSGKSVCSLFTL